MKVLDKYKRMLIVVDIVNGFVREGVLHDKNIESIIPKIVELVEDSIKEQELVVFL